MVILRFYIKKESALLKNLKIKNYYQLALWLVLLLTVSSLMGMLTRNSINVWYAALVRSPLTPPNYVFSVVWIILYIMIAVSGWMIWSSYPFKELKRIKGLYLAQLFLNWMWTPLFFYYHFIGSALICLFSIVVLVALIIKQSYQSSKITALMLTPYFVWVLFALYLNGYIWLYN
jgi:benzodiazapine receptor